MSSCYAQDANQLLMLLRSVCDIVDEVSLKAGDPSDPSGPCDPDWCKIERKDHGKACKPGKCNYRGREEDRAKCAGELWGWKPGLVEVLRPAVPRRLSAAERKDVAAARAKLAKAAAPRDGTVREVREGLERILKALKAAQRRKVLAAGEDQMLEVLEGWRKILADEVKAHRPK